MAGEWVGGGSLLVVVVVPCPVVIGNQSESPDNPRPGGAPPLGYH